MSHTDPQSLANIRKWFDSSRRDLPWRDNPSPYAVWVSEVMLQQTQVAVVIPYFLNWMEQFPSIHQLAKASLDEVIKAWEGLGYYSRARNLHEGAKYVVAHHGGKLPDTWEELSEIKGLGPYTIGAILSFAFHQRVPAVDGNVIRVLTRFLGIEADISKPKTVQYIREQALTLLPEKESWVTTEALIELGATVCQKKAKCEQCPLKKNCVAHKAGLVDKIPYKSAKTQYEKLERTVAVVTHGDHFLVKRGVEGQIMSDLHEFPFFEGMLGDKKLCAKVKTSLKLDISINQPLKKAAHSFTRYRVNLYPFLCRAKKKVKVEGFQWMTRQELERFAFSSGHRRVWAELTSANFKYL